MWILLTIPERSGIKENVHYLICGTPLNVAREGSEHIVFHDKTVSKVHATFSLTHLDAHLACPERLPEVILNDLRSTNGTYVRSASENFVRVTPNEPVVLKQGDVVQFGKNNKCRLQYKPLVVASSQITSKLTKETLKNCIKCLGGHLVKDWVAKCSFLVMNDLTLTTKTVCALASGSHIVTPNFLLDTLNAVKRKEDLPNPKNYLPVLKEPSINSAEVSFHPNPLRKNIFAGKTFFFQDEVSLKKMKTTIIVAGGSAVLLSESNYNMVVLENSIVIKSLEKGRVFPNFIVTSLELLKSKSLQPVPESDIGLAIVHNSIERYCNPRFKITGILQQNSIQSQKTQNLVVFATETQDETEDNLLSSAVSRTTILESGESSKSKSSSTFPKPVSSVKEMIQINKENILKRKRSLNETVSPDKVQAAKAKRKAANTEPLAVSYDELDNAMNFSPKLSSTEKDSPEKALDKTTSKGCKETSQKEKALDKTNSKDDTCKETSHTNNIDTAQETLEIPDLHKSIPFDPYTLPSIQVGNLASIDLSLAQEDMEEDENTQPFSEAAMIKEEPQSQSDLCKEETFLRPKSKDAAMPKETTVAESSFISKRSPVTAIQNATTSIDDDFNFIKPAIKAEPRKMEENEFSLPFSTQRKRRQRDTSEESPVKESICKRIKMPENVNEQAVNNKSTAGNSSLVIKKSNSEIIREEEVNDVPFISKNSVKQEKSSDDISALGQTLERSLIVVEVVNLIRIKPTDTSTSGMQSNPFNNFKRFKKVLPCTIPSDETDEVSLILPRIIGGQDLVCSSDMNRRMETYLASQTNLDDHLQQRREHEVRENNDAEKHDDFDTDFNLLGNQTQRRRGRIR